MYLGNFFFLKFSLTFFFNFEKIKYIFMDNLPSTTTQEQDNESIQARKLDLLVEITQALLALAMTVATIFLAVKGITNEDVSNSFFIIIGFYFGKQLKDGVGKIGLTIQDISKK